MSYLITTFTRQPAHCIQQVLSDDNVIHKAHCIQLELGQPFAADQHGQKTTCSNACSASNSASQCHGKHDQNLTASEIGRLGKWLTTRQRVQCHVEKSELGIIFRVCHTVGTTLDLLPLRHPVEPIYQLCAPQRSLSFGSSSNVAPSLSAS